MRIDVIRRRLDGSGTRIRAVVIVVARCNLRHALELSGQIGRGGDGAGARGGRINAPGHRRGRTYTFTIRPGFRFAPPSNQAVTAQTFKDTIERTLNPEMKNPVLSEFNDIVGAQAYIAGKANHISGVIVRGDRLIIHLNEPDPVMPVCSQSRSSVRCRRTRRGTQRRASDPVRRSLYDRARIRPGRESSWSATRTTTGTDHTGSPGSRWQ